MPILGIDPGDHTGVAIVDKGKVIFTTEIIYIQKKKLKHMEELLYLENIKKIYQEFLPDAVIIETCFFSKFVNTVKSLTKKITLITVAVRQSYPEALICMTEPAKWKSLLGGIPQKTKFDQRTEQEKYMARLKEILGYEIENEHVCAALCMAFAYEGKVRIKR